MYKEFHEKKCFQDIEAGNSSTCSKEGFMVAIGISSKRRVCKSMDINLQEETFNIQVYLCHSLKDKMPQDYLWKLSECLFGLSVASSAWYLTIRKEPIMLKALPPKYDQAIFIWHFNHKLYAINTIHIDGFCFDAVRIFIWTSFMMFSNLNQN